MYAYICFNVFNFFVFGTRIRDIESFLLIQHNILLFKSFDSSEVFNKLEENRSISNITLKFVHESCQHLALSMPYTYDPGVCCYCPKERNK